jgi:hypothetical protein
MGSGQILRRTWVPRLSRAADLLKRQCSGPQTPFSLSNSADLYGTEGPQAPGRRAERPGGPVQVMDLGTERGGRHPGSRGVAKGPSLRRPDPEALQVRRQARL